MKKDSNFLFKQIMKKESFLCIGLDIDPLKLKATEHEIEKVSGVPIRSLEDYIFAFGKAIIDNTHCMTVAYKFNLAFYLAQGKHGYEALSRLVNYLIENHPEIFIIIDAKTGDIGNSSEMYAKAYLDLLKSDAVTVQASMGKDSMEPFMNREGKWAVVLGLTSNPGSKDIQMLKLARGFFDWILGRESKYLYQELIKRVASWGTLDNTMFVVGATKANMLAGIRKIIPDHFLLIPGIGAQGGDFDGVMNYGMNDRVGLLVNNSRGIINALERNRDNEYEGWKGDQFAEAAAREAARDRGRMRKALQRYFDR